MFSDDTPSLITPRYYLGSMAHANNSQLLQDIGITHILSVCASPPSRFPRIVYKHVNVSDTPNFHLVATLQECFRFLHQALNRNGTVLVHCFAGVSRSASITIAFLMKNEQLTYEVAFRHVRQQRPVVSPNYGFVHQLQTYSRNLIKDK